MKIATWNVNSLRVRLDQVLDWLKTNSVDVLCLQEIKLDDPDFPRAEFEEIGYQSVFSGQKSYNGVAILSRQTLTEVGRDLPDYEDPQRRYIAGSCQGVRIVNVYVPNGQSLDSEKFIYKKQWFAKLRAAMREQLKNNSKLVLMGDFNITPAELDVHDPKQWQGKIHCSDEERLMLQTLMSEGLYDVYRQFHPQGDQFTWWDYRGGGFSANEGLRIDLILASAEGLKQAQECQIDEQPRRNERPSDHTPVIAEFDFS